MAGRIAGITIKIGADSSDLTKNLEKIDSELKKTQTKLKDVNKLLKLDPKNTELLTQKQAALKKAISDTKDRLKELKDAQSGVSKGTEEWDALQREIIDTEQKLKGLQTEYRNFGSVGRQQIAAVGRSMQEIGGKIGDVGRKLQPISTAAAGVVTALAGIGYKAITSADELTTLAQQTGLSTDELQKMQYASDLVDVSLESITGALRKMKAKIDPANETFKTLGVSVTDADGSLRSATDVFYDTLTALSQIENETERDQLAMDLFGKSADELAGIIDDGGEALKAYGKEAEDLGLILSEDTIGELNDMNDTVDRLKATFSGSLGKLGATLAKSFAPALEKVAAAAQKLADKIANLSPEQAELIVKIGGVVAAIAPLLIIGGKLISGIGAVAAALASPIGAIGLAIAAAAALAVAVYKHWDEIVAFTQNLGAKLKATWENIKSSVSTAVSNLYTSVIDKFNMIRSTASGIWNGIKSTVSNAINGARDAVSSAIEKIKGFLSFEWNLPKLKLPHIKLTAGEWPWGIMGKGVAPTVGIEWYKKAYDNPVMFTSPTVLATPGGYKGFGDGSGSEIVLGLNKLQELVGNAGSTTINVYPPAGANTEEIAAAVEQRLAAAQRRRLRVYA